MGFLAEIQKWLDGKKSYISAILFAIFNFAVYMGWIDPGSEVIKIVDSILLALFGISLRAGVKKNGKA